MSFPLYDNLLEQTNTDRTIEQREVEFFLSELKHRSDIHELVYAIIRCHQLNHDCIETYLLPYGGKKLKKGIKFDFDKLPDTLQHLLIAFLRLHRQSIVQKF